MLKILRNVAKAQHKSNEVCDLTAASAGKYRITIVPKENLNVHEYVGIDIMRENGIAVPKGKVTSSPEEARLYTSLVFLVMIL